MTPEIIEMLEQEEHPDNIQELLEEVVDAVNNSRTFIAANYPAWDKSLETYKRKKHVDASDARAKQKGEPAKMVVPLTYAQCNTLVTFLFISLTSKDSVFELSATGDEDFPIREVAQAVVDREVRQTNYHMRLVEALLDMVRFSLGVLKTSWEYESVFVTTTPPEQDVSFLFDPTDLTIPQEPEVEEEEVILKEGCKIENISPYHFFYDTRVPLPRWKEGRFAADEQSVNLKDLKRLDKQGFLAGTKHIKEFDRELWTARGGNANNRLEGVEPANYIGKKPKGDRMVARTSVQYRLTPSEHGLGDSDDEEIWVVTIANDSRIIGLQPLNSPTNEFQYDILQLLPDQHADLSDSLSKLIDPIQEVITWLINARVASVRRNIDGRLVVDQQHVDMSTLNTNSPFILLKKSAPRMGTSRFIEQLRTTDPTASHFNDSEALIRILYMVSGVNENSMGAFAPGRRSATENRTANAGASARMKLIGASCWYGGLASLGRKLLLSCRQDMSFKTFSKIVGAAKAEQYYDLFHPASPYELYSSEDFFTYDATIESERNYVAQSLQELFLGLVSNPEVAASMQLDLPAMLNEIYALRGVKNLSRFKVKAQPGLPAPGLPPIPPVDPNLTPVLP
jgi:hypothetical protein